MSLVAFMLIVNRTGTAAGYSTDRGSWSTASNGADSRATRRTNTYSFDGPANPMPTMIPPMINHIGHYRTVT